MTKRIRFTVLGKPEPAGSKRAFPIRRKDGSTGVAVSDANPRNKSWQQAVATAARDAYDGPLLTGGLVLQCHFYFARPKSHYGSGRNADVLKPAAPSQHIQKPDGLKLRRAIEDALTGVLWLDDCQIVGGLETKHWAEPGGVMHADVLVMDARELAEQPT